MMKTAGSVIPWPEKMMETYLWLDALLLAQASTEKEFQPAWQAYKYLLRAKMYAYIGTNDQNGRPIITLKLEPLFSDMLRQEHDDIVPGYYMNKQHWSTAYLDGAVPKDVLADMVHASYRWVCTSLSKKTQLEISQGMRGEEQTSGK